MLIFAESLGALAVVINFIGYRQNDINRYRVISALALLSVGIHFFLLGAMAAGIGCFLACARNIVSLRYQNGFVVGLFVAINFGFLAYEWFLLNHHWNIFIAYASSIIFTIGTFVLKDITRIRQWFILAEVLGLIYSLLVGSIFGSVFNISNLISIFVKLLQDNRHKKSE